MSSSIPVAQRNQIKKDTISCIVDGDHEAEECLLLVGRRYDKTKEQMMEIADEIMEEANDE